jgi:hypothetical protein
VIVNQEPQALEIINLALAQAQNIDPLDPSVTLLVDADRDGIPDIIEQEQQKFIYLPIVVRAYDN